MTTFTEQRLEQIVDELRGTCKSLNEVLEDDEDVNSQQLAEYLDNHIFCCTVCEWWHDMDEMADGCGDEWVCRDCMENEDGY